MTKRNMSDRATFPAERHLVEMAIAGYLQS